ncbi:Golgi membrane protein 1-like isoform X2 [Heptranchias perlo]|uniref:Golgi membrane protein 1-like isoform X2 n=1 Tax=Heptranchias perlo TaxID=212740 RepID=UPI00355A71C6
MVGLGSGRRGARSPPLLLLLLALGACLAFLALSYWVSSSRSAELQARVALLDAKVRRAAADISATELQKHQLQLQLQSQLEDHKEEVGQLGQLHRQQLESEARFCNEEKEAKNKNITSSTRIIQTLQEQFRELQMGYGLLNQKLQELQKKLTYDITQCSNQINDQKELYEEQIKELYKRLAEATKFQPGNRNTEATKQNKLLTEHKSTEKQDTAKPSAKEQQPPGKNNDHTDHLEVKKRNELEESTMSTKLAEELENNKLLDTDALEDGNGTRVDEEEEEEARRNAGGEDQNNLELLDVLKQKQPADYNGDEGNVAEFEADKEAALVNDIKARRNEETMKILEQNEDHSVKQLL